LGRDALQESLAPRIQLSFRTLESKLLGTPRQIPSITTTWLSVLLDITGIPPKDARMTKKSFLWLEGMSVLLASILHAMITGSSQHHIANLVA